MNDSIISITIPEEAVMSKIYLIRNAKIMIDRDLAELYGVGTKVLKQSVKRNIRRFPPDFMFEMSEKEFDDWRKETVSTGNVTKEQTKNRIQISMKLFILEVTICDLQN